MPRWYGFAYLCGFVAAYILLIRLARRGMLRMSPDRVPDLVLNGCIFGILLGGRLGYCLFYDPSLLGPARDLDGHLVFPYWGVLAVWHGGMAAHGGVIFTILALLYFTRRHKYSFVNVGDAASMVIPIGLFFGRIANFINGELYGHPSNVSWAVKFPTELTNRTNNPYDLSEAARQLQNIEAGRILDWAQLKFPTLKITGISDLITQLQQGSAGVSESIRARFAAMDSLPARHPSQLYEALLEGALLFVIVWIIGRKWRKDGMASGAFLTLYPVMRIIGEQFRVGDAPVTIAGLTLSKGVWYSVLMFLPGALYWAFWIKKNRTAVWVPQKAAPAPGPKDAG